MYMAAVSFVVIIEAVLFLLPHSPVPSHSEKTQLSADSFGICLPVLQMPYTVCIAAALIFGYRN